MTINEIKSLIQTPEYDFLRTNEHLGSNIILLTLGGSHAYGTNVAGSDVDIRGCALNAKDEILTNKNFEQFVNEDTDTTIYEFNKLITLLSNVNPNTIELLGCKPEHYIYLSPIGKELLDNRHLFLSKKCVHSFGGYANAQLRRLDNKAVRLVSQSEQEVHILKSIENAAYSFKDKYFQFDDDMLKLYIDKSEQEEYDTEVFMDINLKHYPLRDYKNMWSEMNNIVKEYGKLGKRNSHAIEHNKLSKHMMHLVRLYLMCLDILNDGEIITYREKDHDFLMEIRNGKYLDENRQPIPEFFDIVDDLEAKLDKAKETTDLPDNPDYKKINEFVASVNERIVRGEIGETNEY
jgi:predicted nucleotidyltransferase